MQLDRKRAVSIVVIGKHPSCRTPEAHAALTCGIAPPANATGWKNGDC
jgi:hypothetical protein